MKQLVWLYFCFAVQGLYKAIGDDCHVLYANQQINQFSSSERHTWERQKTNKTDSKERKF